MKTTCKIIPRRIALDNNNGQILDTSREGRDTHCPTNTTASTTTIKNQY
jgi:hypothetical protein